MARYMKPIDIWQPDIRTALEAGNLVIQPGQWVKCGRYAEYYSRLQEVVRDSNGGIRNIRSFHGPNASKNYLQYVNAIKGITHYG